MCDSSGVNVSANVHGGDYVYLAPGAKINENLTIADHVIVGSNCVVTHSIEDEGCTVAGVPAKKMGRKKSIKGIQQLEEM